MEQRELPRSITLCECNRQSEFKEKNRRSSTFFRRGPHTHELLYQSPPNKSGCPLTVRLVVFSVVFSQPWLFGKWEERIHNDRKRHATFLFCVLEQGPSKPDAVTDTLDIARGSPEWHLNHLTEQDLIKKQRDNNNRVTLVAAMAAEIARLLEGIPHRCLIRCSTDALT